MSCLSARRPSRLACLLFLGAVALPTARAAEEKPLWEAGIGLATVRFAAYRGADQSAGYVLPAPYFVYRGEFLKADRNGVRGELFTAGNVDLTISAALSPPAYSDQVRARAGMPDLRASAELGPQLDIRLWQGAARSRELKLQVPLRAAFTLQGRPQPIGWVLHPKLNLDLGRLDALPGWNIGLQLGPLWGDRRQHAYYYGVDPTQATSARPAYAAAGGYGGMQALVGVSKRFGGYWVGGFVRYDNLSGASFADSPLVRSNSNLAAGVAVSWLFGESATRVLVDE